MQRRAEVVGVALLVRAEQEHAGQRRNAELGHRATHEHARLDLQRRIRARHQLEAVGARGTLGIHQREEHQRLARRRGALDPEFPEGRELLGHRQAGVDGQPARGEPVDLALADHAEVARAEDAHHFVELVRPVHRVQHAETRVAEVVGGGLVELEVAEVKTAGRVADLLHVPADDLVDLDRRAEVHALVVEAQPVRRGLVLPLHGIQLRLDLDVVGKLHLREGRRQVADRGHIGLVRHRSGAGGHVVEREGGGGRAGREHARERDGRQGKLHLVT
ncbi:hypothetical protein D3C81_1161720 [compost metagenome]